MYVLNNFRNILKIYLQNQHVRMMRRHARAFRTITAIMMTYVVTWLPYNAVVVAEAVSKS